MSRERTCGGGAATRPRAPVPFDASITTGTLKNGLRYFVRANGQPLNRAELRLVVNAGSLVEDDDQRGLAHFVEHMAFNGTKRFPRQAIAAFMESIGMRFGPSVNATTSYDETTYTLQIPTDNTATIERALLILETGRIWWSLRPAKSTRSAAWSSKSGASAAARGRVFRTRCCPCC